MSVDDVIAERGKTHGRWIDNALYAQLVKEAWRKMAGWEALSMAQKEALEMIASKVGRILSGNPITWITGRRLRVMQS
jgi:hypothetical protein